MSAYHTIRTTVLFAAMLLMAPNVWAVYPDITGTWTGTTSSQGACTPSPPSTNWTGPMTLTISNQSLGAFDADILVTGPPGVTFAASITGGSFYDPSTLNPMFFTDDGPAVTINAAAVSGDTMTVIFSYAGFGSSPVCAGAGTVTLTRGTGGDIIDPEVAPSNLITSDVSTLITIINTITTTISARVQGALRGTSGGFRRAGLSYMLETPSGMAAGDTYSTQGLWGSYAYSDFENDFSRTKYDGNRHMIFLGADFAPRDNMVLGVAIGYEDTSIDTDFNRGKLDADGWTIAPYFAMILDDTWNIDANAGYSEIDTDQDRSGGTITSDFDTERWFISANINGFTSHNSWLFSSRTGLLHTESEDDGFTEVGAGGLTVDSRTTRLTQFNIGGDIAYTLGDFEPYVTATYNYDLNATDLKLTAGSQPSNDKDDVLFGVGFRYFNADNLSINAQYDTRLDRADIDEDTYSIDVRWDF